MHEHEAGTLHTLQRHDRTIAYYLHSADQPGATLVCLHGLASNATRWYEYLQHTRLKAQCQLIAMDLCGHGRAITWKHYSRVDWLEDISQVMEHYTKPVFLLGHSMGAQIALEYARQNPDQVGGMILIDPVFPRALNGHLRRVARFRPLLKLVTMLLRLPYRLGWPLHEFPYRDLHQLDLKTRAFLAANPDKDIAELYMDPFADLKFIPVLNYLQDLYEVTRPLPDLSEVLTPKLVLLSTGASTSQVDTNRAILASLANCEVETVNADHWLLTERPIQARDTIDRWIEQQLNATTSQG